MRKIVYVILLVANALVLLGMAWPEGMPAFAHTVNVATLVANLVVFALLWSASRKKKT